MAKAPPGPRGRTANVTRRALLAGIAAAPIAGAAPKGVGPIAWQRAVQDYAAADHAYDAFMRTVLRPAYRLFDAELARMVGSANRTDDFTDLGDARSQVQQAERRVVDAGGDRAAVVALRAVDPGLAAARKLLAQDLAARRARKHLLRHHRIYELEDRGNTLASARSAALHRLIALPVPDREGVILKMRLAYEEIIRNEDYDCVVGMIFADVERLWH